MPATWHRSLAVQVTGWEPVQVPAVQAYAWKQVSEPVQLVPSATAGLEHEPEMGSHVPAAWHWSLAVHTTGLDPLHTPLVHV